MIGRLLWIFIELGRLPSTARKVRAIDEETLPSVVSELNSVRSSVQVQAVDNLLESVPRTLRDYRRELDRLDRQLRALAESIPNETRSVEQSDR